MSLNILNKTSERFWRPTAYDITYDAPFSGEAIEPVGGDQFVIMTYRPFQEGDYFSIISKSASTDMQKAKDEMFDIKIVSNPYIAGALWESRTIFGAGRGEWKIDFIHLPPKCINGVYIYHVETSDIGTKIGKFAVIK